MVQLSHIGRTRRTVALPLWRFAGYGKRLASGRLAAIGLLAILILLPGCPRNDLRVAEYRLFEGVGGPSQHSIDLTALYGTQAAKLAGLTVEFRSSAQPCEQLRSGRFDFAVLQLESVLECTDTNSVDEARSLLASEGFIALQQIELDAVEYLPILSDQLASVATPSLVDQLEDLHDAIDAAIPSSVQNPDALSTAILASDL